VKKIILSLIFLFAGLILAQAQTKPFLSLADAPRITAAAAVKALAKGWNVVIVILDDGGNLISLQRMDGVQVGSIEVAQAKAKSAEFSKRPTKIFEDAMKGKDAARIPTLPNAVEVGVAIQSSKLGKTSYLNPRD
jgi:uncharacterized protein GlcG (DUF336 family)